MKISRRSFLAGSLVGAGTAALSVNAGAWRQHNEMQPIVDGRALDVEGDFLITHGNGVRQALNEPYLSCYSIINAGSGKSSLLGTRIHEVHYGFRPAKTANPKRSTLLMGYNSQGQIEVVDKSFQHQAFIEKEGIVFRGHVIDHEDGVLLTCIGRPSLSFSQQPATEDEHGFLVHMSLDGRIIKKSQIWGVLPHQMADCGEFLAVSDYGFFGQDKSEEFFRHEKDTGFDPFMYRVTRPGVCIVNKETLEPIRYVELPPHGLVTHLARDNQGNVLVTMVNTRLCGIYNPGGVYAYAKRDNSLLMESEISGNAYLEPFPIYQINPTDGSVTEIRLSPRKSRRAHDIVFNPVSGHTVTTFSASDTLWVKYPDGSARFWDSVAFGVTEPRGVCAIEGTPYFAVAGAQSNIAVLDFQKDGPLIDVYRVRLGTQSHLTWLAA